MVKLIKSNYRISNDMFGKRVTKCTTIFFQAKKIIVDKYFSYYPRSMTVKLNNFCNRKLKSIIKRKLQRVDPFHKPRRLDSIKILQKDLQNFIHFQSTKRKMYKFRVRGIPFVESFNNTVKPLHRHRYGILLGCVSQ